MLRRPKGWRWWFAVAPLGLGIVLFLAEQEQNHDASPSEPVAGTRPQGGEADELLEAAYDHYNRGNYTQAITAYEHAEATARKEGRPDLLAEALSGRGLTHRRLGNFYLAIALYSKALELCRHTNNRGCEAELLHNLGTCYTALGERELAKDFLKDALATWPTAEERSISLPALASIHDMEGEHDVAIEMLREAFSLRHAAKGMDEEARSRGKANCLDRLGSAYASLGQMDKAHRAYTSALGLWRSIGKTSSVVVTGNNLGYLHLDRGEPRRALDRFEKSLRLLDRLDQPDSEAHAWFGKARALRRLNEPAAATSAIERASEIVESLRSMSPDPTLRASLLASRRALYEFYVDLQMQRHASDPEAGFDLRALQTAERFKARSLLDLLHEERGALREAMDEPRRSLEEQLHATMNRKNHLRLELIAADADADEIAGLEKEQRELLRKYNHLFANARAAVSLEPPLPLTPREMQEMLDGETLLLFYALGEERSFLWSVSRQAIRAFELPERRGIENLAIQAYEWLASSGQRGTHETGRGAVGRLGEILLGPIQATLNSQRLVVVPDGWLHYLPFGALGALGDGPLLSRHEIAVLPSGSSLEALRRRAADRAPGDKLLAVFADPAYTRDPAAETVLGDRATSRSRVPPPARLVESRREAQAILALVQDEEHLAALGADASKAAILRGELEPYRIVHFAVHGEIDDERPEFSHLALALHDRDGRPREGRLYLHEIADLRLSADLVVLSACNSALGKQVQGEGIIGMTRGFLRAGASSVLVSLWEVDDAATAVLMEAFYRELLVRGLAPAAALRAAQETMRGNPRWEQPYFWAGFVLQGEWRGSVGIR